VRAAAEENSVRASVPVHRCCLAVLRAAALLAALAVASPALCAEARPDDSHIHDLQAHIRALRAKGQERLEVGDAEAALAAANEILHLMPEDKVAQRLRDEACRAIASRPLPPAEKAKRRGHDDHLLIDVEREMQPLEPGVVLSAKGLHRLRERRAPTHAEPWEAELRGKLGQLVAVEFRQTPLPEALERLSKLGGVRILLDPQAAATAQPVTLAETEMPLGAVLRWVARFGGLDYGLRDGAVYFSTREGLRQEHVLRTYDISGLLAPPADARPPREAGPVELVEKPTEKPAALPDPDRIGRGWAQFIRSSVAPDTWGRPAEGGVAQAQQQATIEYRNGRIVVVHSQEVQDQIADLLTGLRQSMTLQVHIHCRFLFLARADMEALNFEFNADTLDKQPDRAWRIAGGLENLPERGELTRFPNFAAAGMGGLTAVYSYLGDDEVGALLQAVQKRRRAVLLQSARLTCLNTQRAVIQRILSINYVRRIGADEDAEIGNIPEGFILDVQPFVHADQRYITLVLQPQMRQLLELFGYDFAGDPEEFVIGPGPDPVIQGRRIQIPITQLFSVATTVTVPNGGTLLAGGFTEIEDRSGTAGIPFVEHIPCLGRLLRGTDRSAGRRSLFILVTAQTVPDVFRGE